MVLSSALISSHSNRLLRLDLLKAEGLKLLRGSGSLEPGGGEGLKGGESFQASIRSMSKRPVP